MKQFYHKLRQNDSLNMQKHFVFFDTETHITGDLINGEQKLKLGWAKYWNRETQEIKWLYFEDANTFWNWIEDLEIKDLIIYAHNADFDIKQVDGYRQLLLQRGYEHTSTYVKGMVYIFEVFKEIEGKKHKIRMWDSCNYLPFTLEKIGESIGHPKMQTPDFHNVDKEYLSKYCKNDVEVLFLFIKRLIEFLVEYDLTRLKSTGSSLAMNSFKHCFYDETNNPIHIHAHPYATRLERDSYKGGICECYKIGMYKLKDKAKKVDVNSQYPTAMLNQMPVRLRFFKTIEKEPRLKEILFKKIKDYHCIAEVEFTIPDEFGFILNKVPLKNTKNKLSKCMFISGRQTASLNSPELKFIMKHGEIFKVNRLAYYDTSIIFKEYVNFFYDKKINCLPANKAEKELFKLFLNKNYGKWGQLASEYKLLTDTAEWDISSKIVYTPKKDNVHLMHFGNKLYKIEKTDQNAMDSFVAIASAISSYARMHLVKLILKAGKDNIYYSDTDSLIVNDKGFQNLQDEMHETELGKLKLEGVCENFEIIKPKHYMFDGEMKIKGVKKNATVLHENDQELVVMQTNFERFNSMMRKGNWDTQKTTLKVKSISKLYDKGKVVDGCVFRYTFKEVHNKEHIINQPDKTGGLESPLVLSQKI